MAQLETDIIRILSQARDEIRANMQARGVNASGRTSASIHVREYEGGFQLVGGHDGTHPIEGRDGETINAYDTAPIPTLQYGREGGNVPKGFYYILKEWSREKGISFASESERATFAYFLARKIARQGTHRHEQSEDIYTTPVENAKAAIRALIASSVDNTISGALGGVRFNTLR